MPDKDFIKFLSKSTRELFGFPSPVVEKEYIKGNKICLYCMTEGLHWNKGVQKWRLFNPEGAMHECRKIDSL